MQHVASRGDADELTRFRRLVTATIVATFVLILIGGIVRVSDSGLGCGAAGSGTHGWPLCEGGLLPADSAESAVEFSHRVAATIVVLLIGLVTWKAFRSLRARRWFVRGSVAAGVLVLGQAALGGLTVEKGLEDELVAAHLALAMLLLGLLFLLRRASDPATEPSGDDPARAAAADHAHRDPRPGDDRRRRLRRGNRVPGHRRPTGARRRPRGLRQGWSSDQFPGCNGQGSSRSARRGSPTSSSPTVCSCTWRRSP